MAHETLDFTELTRRAPVLVYDYTPNNLPLVQMMLARGGYYAAGVTHAQDALRLCQTYPVALLVCESTGQGMSGLELIQHLRADARLMILPVIVISARTDADSLAQAHDAGASDYLPRPFMHTQLQAKVRACLEQMAELPPWEQFQTWDDFPGSQLAPDEKGQYIRLPREEGWYGHYYPAKAVTPNK